MILFNPVNFSNCQCGFYILEYKLTVNVHLCIRLTWNITKVVKKYSFIEFWPSIYGFRLPLWYLLTIVLSVLLRYTDSDYPFGIFWPLCCLSFFDIWILITPLVSSNSSCISYHNGFFAIHQVVVSPRNNGQYRYNTYLILIGFIKL